MNRPLLEWVDCALALQAENDELRRLMVALIAAIGRNREILEFARGEIAARWPEAA